MSRSWAEVLTGGEKNLGLTQTTGQKEESNQALGQNGGNQKDRFFVEDVGPLQKEVKVEGILMDDRENENKKDLDTLYSFRDLELTFPLKESRPRKRYGSLWDQQEKVLSISDKKKRDRSWKSKKDSQQLQNSELSGQSLSDSDLRNKWERARKEAKDTLDMGKT
ncbi:hypothetical protein V6N12_061681 [Hibiscus sabdariffa]|uniref:Uncharacterized protein n=1 Tax=Hibiscus sabdariffa TaxID=183260 RepID=A0ABR2DXS2_9ROSI